MDVVNRFRIGPRLYLGFALVLMLLAGLTAVAWYGLKTSHAATARVIEMDRRAALTQEWLMSTQININRVMAVATSRNDPAVDGYFKPLMSQVSERISVVQKTLEAEIQSEQGKALLKDIAERRAAYMAVRKTYFDTLKNGDAAGAQQLLTGGLMPAADAYGAKQRELLELQHRAVAEAVAASEATVNRQIGLLMLLALSASGLAMVLAWRITRSVTQPLAQAVDVTREVAAGDLRRDVRTERTDELGDLLRALGDMKTSLTRTVSLVRSATDSIDTASQEIATGNQDLSSRTEQTASNLQETAASMEQLTGTVRQSADSA
ncbi:HAMP domain-containing protein, partial [Hydrogenophaga borbori]